MELGYRRSRGENPTREEYVQKFPDDADAVRNVFDEPPVAHIAESSFSSQGRAVPEMLGKFQVIGRLGTGGQGSALLGGIWTLAVLSFSSCTTPRQEVQAVTDPPSAMVRP